MAETKAVVERKNQVMTAFELDAIKAQLSAMMQGNPRKIESFKTKILTLSMQYGLKECTPESIINSGLMALTVDLPIQQGQGHVVNYGGQAQFDVGYKGWKVLAKRDGYDVLADTVYMCDEFSRSGFGHNKKITFKPAPPSERHPANDDWAKENLTGVIVSILEVETKTQSVHFVDAEMIHKIVGKSPSVGKKDKYGNLHSPHDNWADQMYAGKAVKQVLSKFPIDLSSSQLATAIEVVNNTESVAQDQTQPGALPEYPQDRLDENYPQWVKLIKKGSHTGVQIATQLTNSYSLTEGQMEQVMALRDIKAPIDGETVVNPEDDLPERQYDEDKVDPEYFGDAPDAPDHPARGSEDAA